MWRNFCRLKKKAGKKREEASKLLKTKKEEAKTAEIDAQLLELAKTKCRKKLESAQKSKRLTENCIAGYQIELNKIGAPIDIGIFNERKASIKQNIQDIKNARKEIEEKLSDSKEEYEKLGMFKHSEKKTLKAIMTQFQAEINECDQKIKTAEKELSDNQIKEVQASQKNQKNEEIKKISARN